MKITCKVYKKNKDKLNFISEGHCIAYSPIDKNNDVSYISFDFGNYKIHMDPKDFIKYCKHFLEFNNIG